MYVCLNFAPPLQKERHCTNAFDFAITHVGGAVSHILLGARSAAEPTTLLRLLVLQQFSENLCLEDAGGPRFHKSTLWPHILHLEGFHLRRGRPVPEGGHGPFVVAFPLQRRVDEETDERGRAVSD